MVARIPMRTEPAKNRPYISGKIWPFWIGHCSALSSVLVGGQRSSFLLRCRIDQGPVLLSLMAGQVGVFVRAAASR